jgi:predicted membrane-bound spermidine synthase
MSKGQAKFCATQNQFMTARTRLVALLLFGSGFCALIYQTTWLREFRLVFGVSTAATAAVVGVFMAGMGLGGIFLGRRSERAPQPLRFYANLEFAIAVTAACSPILILAVRHLYIVLGGTATLGVFFGTIVRLAFAAVIVGAPTFLMGGTLPAAVRAATSGEDRERRAVGFIYGANTLGAVAGACAGTFYLFENIGDRLTLWLAAIANILIATAALKLSGRSGDLEGVTKVSTVRAHDSESLIISRRFVLIAAALVGFAFFLMELVWYRMLGPLVGGSTFSFGLILAVALLGIGFGGLLMEHFSEDEPSHFNSSR